MFLLFVLFNGVLNASDKQQPIAGRPIHKSKSVLDLISLEKGNLIRPATTQSGPPQPAPSILIRKVTLHQRQPSRDDSLIFPMDP